MKRLPRGRYAEKARRSFAIALVEPALFAQFGSSEAVNAAASMKKTSAPRRGSKRRAA